MENTRRNKNDRRNEQDNGLYLLMDSYRKKKSKRERNTVNQSILRGKISLFYLISILNQLV
jgi:hypothetical protein